MMKIVEYYLRPNNQTKPIIDFVVTIGDLIILYENAICSVCSIAT